MPFRKVRFRRPVTSYAKVEAMVGSLIRNRKFQLRRLRGRPHLYLDIGAGRTFHEGFVHVDYLWNSNIDLCWNVLAGLPFAEGSVSGIYSQHMLEHFSLPRVAFILAECRRVLAAGATIRVVVPDIAKYLEAYVGKRNGDPHARFPYEDADVFQGIRAPMISLNRIFYLDRDSLFGHRTMFDFDLMRELLVQAGFVEVKQCACGEGRDERLLVDSESRRGESLYVEAVAPGRPTRG